MCRTRHLSIHVYQHLYIYIGERDREGDRVYIHDLCSPCVCPRSPCAYSMCSVCAYTVCAYMCTDTHESHSHVSYIHSQTQLPQPSPSCSPGGGKALCACSEALLPPSSRGGPPARPSLTSSQPQAPPQPFAGSPSPEAPRKTESPPCCPWRCCAELLWSAC